MIDAAESPLLSRLPSDAPTTRVRKRDFPFLEVLQLGQLVQEKLKLPKIYQKHWLLKYVFLIVQINEIIK